MFNFEIDYKTLSLTAEELFAEMGYGQTPPEETMAAMTISMLEQVTSWGIARCSFALFDGAIMGDTVVLDCGESITVGATIASLLKGSERFAIFAATAGAAFEQYQEQLKAEGDILKCFIADVIGTCIAEKTGDHLEHLLKKELSGQKHTHRLSPGYCGWHLESQKTLFRLMGQNPCEIRLSDVCLMEPIKSISGIIGIGHIVDEKKYGCQYCELKTCYKLKMRQT